jgi:hypothetical protein
MAFPNKLSAPESERFNTYTTRRWPLGTELHLQDGRQYRFGRVGASVAAVQAFLYQSEVPDANFDTAAVPSSALNVVGSRDLRVTLPANSIAENLWAEGFAVIEAAAGAGEGRAYKIESHPASAGSEDVTFRLAPGNGLQTALNTSDKVTFMKHHMDHVIIHPAPPTAAVVGIASAPIAASSYGWFQFRGPGPVMVVGTHVIGGGLNATGTVTGSPDGTVEASGIIITTTAATIAQITELMGGHIGICMEVAPTTGAGMALLTM